jgi:predicted transcriptional regulator
MAKTGKKTEILNIIIQLKTCSSMDIFNKLENKIEYATVKRVIGQLLSEKSIISIGIGKATRYQIAEENDKVTPVDVK